MSHRLTFEREVRDLENSGGADAVVSRRTGLRKCAPFQAVKDGVYEAVLSGELVKGTAIAVTVRYYEGTTKDVGLVFAGVHGDEDEGTVTATAMRTKLDAAYAANPKSRAACQTLLIENLRADRDTIDPASKSKRWVDGIEPNRNFPLTGEGLSAAGARRKKLGFDLVDPDTRRFPNLPPRAPKDFKPKEGNDRESKLIIAENRLLIQLIGCIKPDRAVSIHSHGVQNKRGDGPGVFVDPRGGLDTDLDAPLTAQGRLDDKLADRLLKAALKGLPATKLSKQEQKEALQGNQPGSAAFFGETVHYSFGAPKARGTSFGMWASAPVSGQGNEDRKAMQTITLELPKWLKGGKKKQTDMLADLWASILIEHFLGLK